MAKLKNKLGYARFTVSAKPTKIYKREESIMAYTGANGLVKVSDFGNVYLTQGFIPVKQKIGYNGYRYVEVYDEGKKYTISVAEMVLYTFGEDPEDRIRIRHHNGDLSDNRLSNLSWVKPKRPSDISFNRLTDSAKMDRLIYEHDYYNGFGNEKKIKSSGIISVPSV